MWIYWELQTFSVCHVANSVSLLNPNMSSCSELVKQYKEQPDHHAHDLWSQMTHKGVRAEHLRELLLFYCHHKVFAPPTHKSFSVLVQTLVNKGTSKKMRNIIYQIVEEICSCLDSSIVETINFTPHNSVAVDLLNCILIGGFIPLLDEGTVEKLFNLLQSSSIPSIDRSKTLSFLCQAIGSNPTIFPREQVASLCQQMTNWLREMRGSVGSPNQVFKWSDTSPGSEVDGTTAGEQFTVLTLANNFTDGHIMGMHTFSILQEWLARSMSEHNQLSSDAIREYCSLVVEQSFRPALKEHDIALQKAALCEVLDIVNQLVQHDRSQTSQCLLMVKRIQGYVTEKFKADYRDISIFVRVLNFLLNIGETTGYSSSMFCEKFLGDIVYRSYSSGLAAFDIAVFLVENQQKIAALPQPMLPRFFPNLFKLIACHPSALVEEFINLIPALITPQTAVEVFHSLLDLPILSATLCLHQAPAVLQLHNTSSAQGPWLTLLENMRSTEYRPIFSYVMRQESGQGLNLESISVYLELLKQLSNHPLVVTCSQIAPLLLDTFMIELETQANVQVIADVVLAVFIRLRVLFDVPGYSASIHSCLCQHMHNLFRLCPQLVFLIQTELMQYISIVNNSKVCPRLYIHLVWAVGEYSSSGYSDRCNHDLVAKYYEAVECIVYEMLNLISSQEAPTLQLLNVTCAALAKLASRCQDLIPRVLLCLSKVRSQVIAGLPTATGKHKQIMCDRIDELLCLLHNPNIASVVMSSSHENNPAMSAVVRVLAQFADS